MDDKGERQPSVWHHWFRDEVLKLGDVEEWLGEDVVGEWAGEQSERLRVEGPIKILDDVKVWQW